MLAAAVPLTGGDEISGLLSNTSTSAARAAVGGGVEGSGQRGRATATASGGGERKMAGGRWRKIGALVGLRKRLPLLGLSGGGSAAGASGGGSGSVEGLSGRRGMGKESESGSPSGALPHCIEQQEKKDEKEERRDAGQEPVTGSSTSSTSSSVSSILPAPRRMDKKSKSKMAEKAKASGSKPPPWASSADQTLSPAIVTSLRQDPPASVKVGTDEPPQAAIYSAKGPAKAKAKAKTKANAKTGAKEAAAAVVATAVEPGEGKRAREGGGLAGDSDGAAGAGARAAAPTHFIPKVFCVWVPKWAG